VDNLTHFFPIVCQSQTSKLTEKIQSLKRRLLYRRAAA
jgi:hypothetical protein